MAASDGGVAVGSSLLPRPGGRQRPKVPLVGLKVCCAAGVLRHHCPGRDFSHWVADVFHDQALADGLLAAEASLPVGSPDAVANQVRLALIAALQERHLR